MGANDKFTELALGGSVPNYGEISLQMTFDAAHRVVGHKGKCARLHGHTYDVHIMAAGEVKDPGFVVDFGDLKDMVNEWDHMTLLWEEDPLVIATEEPLTGFPEDEGRTRLQVVDAGHVVRLPFNPTAENMAKYLCLEATARFELSGCMVELKETAKSMARYLL